MGTTKETNKTLSDIEKDWYSEVSKYLYDTNGERIKGFVDTKWNSNSIITKYKQHNNKNVDSIDRKDRFVINDVYLTIPPQHIDISFTNNVLDIPYLRGKSVVKADTGYGEIALNINVTFSDDMAKNINLEDELRYKFVPIVTQLETMPFCTIESEYVSKVLISKIKESNDITGINSFDDIMFTYQGYSYSTVEESPRIITANFRFLMFNYAPFVDRIMFAKDYKRKNGIIIRNNDMALDPSFVKKPENSKPFYEFFAKEFEGREKLAERHNHSIDTYEHIRGNDSFSLEYSQYYHALRKYIDSKYAAKIKQEKTYSAPSAIGTIKGKKEDFRKAIIQKESSGDYTASERTGLPYYGAYQFGKERLYDLGVSLDGYFPDKAGYTAKDTKTLEKFLNDASLQDTLWDKNVSLRVNEINKNIDSGYLQYDQSWQDLGVTISGLVAGAHLGGIGGIKDFLDGSGNPSDNNGTSVSDYVYKFSGYGVGGNEQLADNSVSAKKLESISNKDTSISKSEVSKALESLPKGSYDILQSPYGGLSYIRTRHTLKVPLLNSGISIIHIEGDDSVDIAKIPISGHRYPVHQYMGGHVKKLSVTFAITSEYGYEVFRNMKTTLDIVASNAIKFKNIAPFDGIVINNSFINCIHGGDRFVVDSLDITTDANIPGASVAVLNMTDITHLREQAKKLNSFNMDSAKKDNYYYSIILKTIFKKYRITAKYIPPYQFRVGSTKFEIVNLGGVKSPKYKKALRKLVEYLNDADFNSPQKDVFGISNMVQFYDNSGKLIPSLFTKDGEGKDLYLALTKWASSYSKVAYDNEEDIKKDIPENYKVEMGKISSPAYSDFNLPPTIDPDYFFYQKKKYFDSAYSDRSIRLKEKTYKEFEKRFKWYNNNLDTKNYTQIDGKKHFLENFMSDPEDIKTMKSDKDRDVASNVARTTISEENFTDSNASYNDEFIPFYKLEGELDSKIKDEPLNDKFNTSIYNSKSVVSQKEILNHHLSDKSIQNRNIDLSYCFPVYKIYIIEQDTIELMNAFRQDMDDMYGMNCIQEIHMVEQDPIDNPADLLNITLYDMSGRFTSARYKPKPNSETKSIITIDTADENNLKGIMIQEGTIIQMRAGYSNNINNLDTSFNGKITSVEVNRGEYNVIAQSFATELMQQKLAEDKPKDISTYNADTEGIFDFILNQPDVKHFGRWKAWSLDSLQYTDSSKSIAPGFYSKIGPDGITRTIWGWTKQPFDINILSPSESALSGVYQFLFQGNPSMWYVLKHLSDITKVSNYFSSFIVYKRTLWSIADEMTYRYPGYITQVVPFENRNTLFYGPTNASYYYRDMTTSEKEVMGAINPESKRNDSDNAIYKVLRNVLTNKGVPQVNKLSYAAVNGLLNSVRSKSIKPFINYWMISSDKDISSNKIKADYRDVFNKIEVEFTRSADQLKAETIQEFTNKEWLEGTVDLAMNSFLQEEDLRKKSLSSPNIINEPMAYDYATHELWRQSRKLYKGSITMLGRPTMKPNDILFVDDKHTQMFGPIVARQHVLHITHNGGMVSDVMPGMYSNISDLAAMSGMDAMKHFLSIESTLDWSDKLVGGVGSVGAATASAAIATSVAATALAAPAELTILATLTAIATATGLMSLSYTLFNYAKYRDPILLRPLLAYGVPYIVGMNTFKIGTMAQWVGNEFKVMTDGLSNVGENVEQIWDSIF